MQTVRDDRSLGELFAELSRETSTLVREEVALAKAETTRTVSRLSRDLGLIAIGGAVLYAGFLAIIAAVIIALAAVIPWWLSALLVGLGLAGTGYFLIDRGRDALQREDLKPQHTIETLKEDAEWAREQVR